MSTGANSFTLDGTISKNPEIDVIASKKGEGKSVVVFDIAYDHPHDGRKPVKRPNYCTIRLYGKTAEAAMKNLQKGDSVTIWNAKRVQDNWPHPVSKMPVWREYYEPPPMGLIYRRIRKLGMGHPFKDPEV